MSLLCLSVSSVKATNVSCPCGCLTNESPVWYLKFFLVLLLKRTIDLRNFSNTLTFSCIVVFWVFPCAATIFRRASQHWVEFKAFCAHTFSPWVICWVALILWHSLATTLTRLCWAQKLPLQPCNSFMWFLTGQILVSSNSGKYDALFSAVCY